MDGYVELSKEKLDSNEGLAELNRMLQLLFSHISSDGFMQRIFQGIGSPEGAVNADKGSIYMRLDGGASSSCYIKESGVQTATGWTAIPSIGGAGGGAPTDAQYVTLATNTNLSDERVLTEGNSITIVDAGANSTVTINAVPGGSDTHVQFNDGGLFGGDDNFLWIKGTNRLGVGPGTPDEQVHINKAVDGMFTGLLIENSQTNAVGSTNETADINFGFGGINDAGRISMKKLSTWTGGNNQGYMDIGCTDAGTVLVNRIRINASGTYISNNINWIPGGAGANDSLGNQSDSATLTLGSGYGGIGRLRLMKGAGSVDPVIDFYNSASKIFELSDAGTYISFQTDSGMGANQRYISIQKSDNSSGLTSLTLSPQVVFGGTITNYTNAATFTGDIKLFQFLGGQLRALGGANNPKVLTGVISNVYIDGPPSLLSGAVPIVSTIGNYALWVDSGTTRLDGDIECNIVFNNDEIISNNDVLVVAA